MTNPASSRFETLLESARLLHSSLDLNALLSHLLRSVMGNLLVRKAVLAVAEPDGMKIALARGCPGLSPGDRLDETKARAAGIEEIFPIGDPACPLGLLGIGPPAPGPLDEANRDFLASLLGLAAGAIVNARAHTEASRLNLELDRRVQELRTLMDLGRGLTASLDPDEVVRLLALTLSGQWAVRKYGVAAWREGHPAVVRQRGLNLGPVETLREAAEGLAQGSLVDDLEPGRLRDLLSSQGVAVVVPLRSTERLLGLVTLGPSALHPRYSGADLDFISGLADQAVVALENAWNVAETVVKKNLERELSLARDIQNRLFPTSLPQVDGYQLAARNRPAREVGGDTYDVIPLDGGELLGCVADVSGKGIAASLLMSNFQATLRALLLSRPSMADLAARMNDLVFATTPSTKFVTALFFRLDPATGALRYVNAGHNDGLLVREGGIVEHLKPGGTPIGLLPSRSYQERDLVLGKGDLLFLYSDGVTEAQGIDEDELGDDRLAEILVRAQAGGDGAEAVNEAVFQAVDALTGEAAQYDDVTVLAVRRTS